MAASEASRCTIEPKLPAVQLVQAHVQDREPGSLVQVHGAIFVPHVADVQLTTLSSDKSLSNRRPGLHHLVQNLGQRVGYPVAGPRVPFAYQSGLQQVFSN
jgi:hypothetical protein